MAFTNAEIREFSRMARMAAIRDKLERGVDLPEWAGKVSRNEVAAVCAELGISIPWRYQSKGWEYLPKTPQGQAIAAERKERHRRTRVVTEDLAIIDVDFACEIPSINELITR